MHLKLFIRVKERIVPDRCTYNTTTACIELRLVKANTHSILWTRLEPNEYFEPVQALTSSSISTMINNIVTHQLTKGRNSQKISLKLI
jgi:hypothetical protein